MAEQNGQSTSDRRRVTLAVCGGVAAYKACELARLLIKADFEVDVVMSRSAQRFIGPLLFEALTGRPTLTDESVGEGGRAYAHLDLGQTCDLVAVVPATANVIGKMAHGIADDELTTMLLAATAPVALAPAMNTGMWQNPIVQQNLERLRRVAGVTIVEPSAGELACGAVGPGRLAEPTAIFERLCAMLEPKPLAGVRVLISAGPTWEAIDPVRLLTNRSTGRMGYELARVAQRRGAEVTLVTGPVSLAPPLGVDVVRVEGAAQMAREVLERIDGVDVAVMSAAVADYTPAAVAAQKIKKGDRTLELSLVRTVDILAEIGRRPTRPLLVGFAAESERLLENATDKLTRKGADVIIANLVGGGAGFGDVANEVLVVERGASSVTLGARTKDRLAVAIWDRLQERLGRETTSATPNVSPRRGELDESALPGGENR